MCDFITWAATEHRQIYCLRLPDARCVLRPASAPLIGRLGESSTAPCRFGDLWRIEKAQPGRHGEHRAGLGGQMMWCDRIRAARLQLRGGPALKSGCRARPWSSLCVASWKEEARRLTEERWVDVNRCSRWDALPSQCGGVCGGGGGGAGCWRFTASHTAALLVLYKSTVPMCRLQNMVDLKMT